MGNLRMCGCELLDGGKTFRECSDHAELRQRAEQAERDRDEARAKVERLRRALFEFAFNWLPDFEEEYSELDTAAPLMAELRAALEDSK